MNKGELARKLRREKLEACLNCLYFSHCNELGVHEECVRFREIEGEAWVITKLVESVK